jgi:hypothetical protein
VLVEKEFGHAPNGGRKYTSICKIGATEISTGGLFGRYWKAVMDNGQRQRPHSLWDGLTERDVELFCKVKNWIHKNVNGTDVVASVLENVRLRSAFHDCFGLGFEHWLLRTSKDSSTTKMFAESIRRDSAEPGLKDTWLKSHVVPAHA